MKYPLYTVDVSNGSVKRPKYSHPYDGSDLGYRIADYETTMVVPVGSSYILTVARIWWSIYMFDSGRFSTIPAIPRV